MQNFVTHEQKQVEKVVTHEQKQVEKVVTHEQKQVEKVVTRAHRVGGVVWRHQSHVQNDVDLTGVNHTWQSNHILFNIACAPNLVAPVTVDLMVKIRILNHEHVSSLLSTGETRSSHVLESFNSVMSMNFSPNKCCFVQ